jgi:hypothetical protein
VEQGLPLVDRDGLTVPGRVEEAEDVVRRSIPRQTGVFLRVGLGSTDAESEQGALRGSGLTE